MYFSGFVIINSRWNERTAKVTIETSPENRKYLYVEQCSLKRFVHTSCCKNESCHMAKRLAHFPSMIKRSHEIYRQTKCSNDEFCKNHVHQNIIKWCSNLKNKKIFKVCTKILLSENSFF